MLDEGFDLLTPFLRKPDGKPFVLRCDGAVLFEARCLLTQTVTSCLQGSSRRSQRHSLRHHGQPIGCVVEMPRNGVDEDKTAPARLVCTLLVRVPATLRPCKRPCGSGENQPRRGGNSADYNDTKGRTCRYEVTGEYADYYSATARTSLLGWCTTPDHRHSAKHRRRRRRRIRQYADGDKSLTSVLTSLDSSSLTTLNRCAASNTPRCEITIDDEDGDEVESLHGTQSCSTPCTQIGVLREYAGLGRSQGRSTPPVLNR
jgi:hypothetical protein